ncbi:MAG: hypothetical protein R3176_08455 [Woeseiaceae bacterium]|nr:hypothetical protein [Woeseiaceae bacterium]
MLRSRIAVFLLALGTPVAVYAVCTCGFGDGRFTLTTINVDGNMADWAPVHADLDNNVCDGPSGGLADRDAPVQSTGRDLTHFAYTWDAARIYLFTERAGSSSNVQSFAYYADVDNDQLMETGEPVIGVTWRGSNRRVDVYVFSYVAATAGGDPMVDGNGFGDGYTLPGSFANVPSGGNPTRAGNWGSANGLQMEFFVTWAELGVAPGSPFTFHVSSSNASLGASSFTAQIDDNLSGCGGGLGSTVIPGVSFTPDRSLPGFAGQDAVAVHTLTNTGNAIDRYDFSTAASGDFSPAVSYYEDTDGSGTLTAGDTLLTDTDGDGNPDSAPLAPSASVTILVVYAVPGTVRNGDVATIVVTAASDFQPLVAASVTDTITAVPAPNLLVSKEFTTISDPVNLGVGPKPIPGSTVEYTITITNQGPGTVDMDTFEISDAVPNDSCLLVTDLGGGGPVRFTDGNPASGLTYTFTSLGSATDDLEFSADGGASYGYTPVAGPNGCDPAVTHLRIVPKGTFAADSGSGSPEAGFAFRILID